MEFDWLEARNPRSSHCSFRSQKSVENQQYKINCTSVDNSMDKPADQTKNRLIVFFRGKVHRIARLSFYRSDQMQSFFFS